MQEFFDDLDKELGNQNPRENASSDTQKPVTAPQKTSPGHTGKKPEAKKAQAHEAKPQKKRAPAPRHNTGGAKHEVRGKFISQFPDTKFYLPSLRDGYTRYMPIGWNNETGAKNMSMVQYGDDLLLIDCWVQFADESLHGVDYSIPDVSFLTKYKPNIKGFLVTHAHLDHIGALKHVLPALGMPPLYWTRLTLWIIKKSLTEAGLLPHAVFVEIDTAQTMKHKIGEFQVEFFPVNHSVPDCAGIYVETPGGAKLVHTGDFKIDYTPELDAPFDMERMENIGKRGITMLMSDSTGSPRPGHTMSEENVGKALEEVISQHSKGRLFIAAFSSWISRVQQLITICEKYDKTIFLCGRSMIENIAIAKELGYLKMKPGTIKKLTTKNTQGIAPNKQIIVTTGSQGEEFSALTRMAEGRHNAVEIVSWDTVIFSSSIVPGNENSVNGIINKLIKLGADVITKADGDFHTGGHAFQDEQKLMARLMAPRYFMPVYGDLYFRSIHKKTIVEEGICKDEDVLLLDNGQIVDFAPKTGNVFRSKIKAPIQDLVIDGHGMGLAGSHVLQARDKMKKWGVLVVAYKVDKKTKAILGHIKLETRGLVYVDEVRFLHRAIIKKCKDAYEKAVKDIPDIEEKDLLKLIRTDLEFFILKKIDREPMIIPLVTEV